MKTIKLIARPPFTSNEALHQVLETPQQHQNCDFRQGRTRSRILDALEKGAKEGDTFQLEDADYSQLMTFVESFRFAVWTRDLEACLSVVFEPVPESKKEGGQS